MITTIAYFAVLLAVLAYLSRYGGKTGLWSASLQLVSWLLSLLSGLLLHGTPYFLPALQIIDFISLGWKSTIALRSSRRWPIWMAAFQLNTVAAHISVWISPHWNDRLYYAMFTVWSIPSLLIMIIGTALDHKHDVRSRGLA